ncbi:MAG TPA: 5-formyltetrahydrofolate cyclo-ligase [Trebonia sp.]|jgi:5-formyltetrahydrofolate cyclo-ligase
MPRPAPRHDRDAGGPAEVLAAKAALRDETWSALSAAKVARFPGAAGRIPNFTGAEKAAELLRSLPAWQEAATVKANPDSPQLPVRQRALEDGKTVYMAVPRLAEPEPFFALDPGHLADKPRKAASISGATRSARRVTLDELTPVDLVVMGSVAVGEDGARLGKGGGFADLEFALASAAGMIAADTVIVTTVHELQVRPAGEIPLTGHDVPVDFVVTPDRVIDCRARAGKRPETGIEWADLTEEKIAAIPLLSTLRADGLDPAAPGSVPEVEAVQESEAGFAGLLQRGELVSGEFVPGRAPGAHRGGTRCYPFAVDPGRAMLVPADEVDQAAEGALREVDKILVPDG